jgi:hypothetical protein
MNSISVFAPDWFLVVLKYYMIFWCVDRTLTWVWLISGKLKKSYVQTKFKMAGFK